MYWVDRANAGRLLADKAENNAVKRLNAVLRQNLSDVIKQIEQFDLKYLKENLTERQRQALLARLRRTSDYYTRDIYLKRLYNTDLKLYRIDRLEQLRAEIQMKLTEMTDEQSSVIDGTLMKAGQQSYDNLNEGLSEKYGIKLHAISKNTIRTLANTAWAGEDNWSARIWKDRKALGYLLDDVLKTGVAQGSSLDKISKQVREKFNTSTYNAMRLVRTETTHIHEQSAMLFYKDTGCKKYRFLAYLDEKTSEVCKEHNRKMFLVSEAKVGVNYPPLHPNCRSTTAPVIDVAELWKKYVGDEDNGIKIIHETRKALLIQKDEKQAWIQRRWLRDDNTLTPAGVRAIESGQLISEIERVDNLRNQGVELPKPDWQSEKAYGFDVTMKEYLASDEEDDIPKFFKKRIFIPKSLVKDNKISTTFLENKLNEIEEDKTKYYMGKYDDRVIKEVTLALGFNVTHDRSGHLRLIFK